MKGVKGFTLIELMVTIAVLAIIVTIAIPSFQDIIERNRVVTQANNILSAVQLARSEAVKRGETITLTAAGGDFTGGWCVHADGACNVGTRIRAFEATTGLVFTGSDSSVAFSARGVRTPQTNTEVVINVQSNACSTGEVDRRSIIRIELTGRAKVNKRDCL
jgi:type IV fimbrial biogenesis protein FimT